MIEVSGKIKNYQGDLLPGAIVFDSLGSGTQSDENGFYAIETEYGTTLTALYGGKSKEIQVNANVIDFVMDDVLGPEVTITGTPSKSSRIPEIMLWIVLVYLVWGLWKYFR